MTSTQLRVESGPTTGIAASVSGISRQVVYEIRQFWRNRAAATFTFVLPLGILVYVGSANKGSIAVPGGQTSAGNYYIPSFIAYGVMSLSFMGTALVMAQRREFGLLRRLRCTPLSACRLGLGLSFSTILNCFILTLCMLGIGNIILNATAQSTVKLFAWVILGSAVFSALGLAAAAGIRRVQGAAPVINIAFLALISASGVFGPVHLGRFLAAIVGALPVVPFLDLLHGSFGVADAAGHSRSIPENILILALWGLVAAVIARKYFRWLPAA